MADISQIKLPNGDTFDLVDEKSGYITVETDPVFSASAAAGITSTDISNWNVKSDTDEKLSVTSNSTVGNYYPILDVGSSSIASKKVRDGFLKFSRGSSTEGTLSIGENGSAIGQIRFFTTTSGNYITITPGTLTQQQTLTLPDKTGTVAVTSDIPTRGTPTSGGTTLSLVNTGDMYDWNNKTQAQIIRW